MATFDYNAEAELFPARLRKSPHRRFGYKRFTRAAAAVRFAIEELPPELLLGAILEVDGERYGGEQIRHLYDADNFSVLRRRTPSSKDHTHPQHPRCLPSSIRAEGRRSNIAGRRVSGDDRRAVDRGAIVSGLSPRLDRDLRPGPIPLWLRGGDGDNRPARPAGPRRIATTLSRLSVRR
jgi:hypothetical protein